MRERNIDRLPPLLTPTGDRTCNPLVYGTMLQPPAPPGQSWIGSSRCFNRATGPELDWQLLNHKLLPIISSVAKKARSSWGQVLGSPLWSTRGPRREVSQGWWSSWGKNKNYLKKCLRLYDAETHLLLAFHRLNVGTEKEKVKCKQ